MNTLKIRGYVDKEEAFAIGSASYGDVSVAVTDELLAALSAEARAFVAKARVAEKEDAQLLAEASEWSAPSYRSLHLPPNFGTQEIAAAIEARRAAFEASVIKVEEAKVARRRREEAETEAAERESFAYTLALPIEELAAMIIADAGDFELDDATRGKISPYFEKSGAVSLAIRKDAACAARLRAAWTLRKELDAKKEAEAAEKAEAEAARLRADAAIFAAYVANRCDENQKERFAAGVLPVDEILALRKADLFPTDFEPYEKLTRDDIEHDCCTGSRAKFTSEAFDGAMTAQAWIRFNEVKRMVLERDAGTKVELRAHKAWCSNCSEGTLRYSIRATATWAGHQLVHLYAIEGCKEADK